MSAYISVYIRPSPNAPYIELDAWSRSSRLFQVFDDYVSYGKYVQLTAEMLTAAVYDLRDEIASFERLVQTHKSNIEFLAQLAVKNSEELDVLMARRSEECEAIDGLNDDIEELQYTKHCCEVLQSFLENQFYKTDSTVQYFLAYECDPNAEN